MFTNQVKLLAALVSVLMITACGGGGGGSSDTPPPAPEPEPAANNAPTISGSPVAVISIGENYSFTPTASDQDNDTLTFSVANQPSWLTVDPQTGELSGVPSINDLGSSSDIVISVSDGSVSTDLSGFAVAVSPPVLKENRFVSEGIKTPIDTGDAMTTGFTSEGDFSTLHVFGMSFATLGLNQTRKSFRVAAELAVGLGCQETLVAVQHDFGIGDRVKGSGEISLAHLLLCLVHRGTELGGDLLGLDLLAVDDFFEDALGHQVLVL